MKNIVWGFLALALAACGEEASEIAYGPEPSPLAMAEEADAISVTGNRKVASPPSPSAEPTEGVLDRYLAYEYNAALRLPAGAVADMVAAHEEACLAAGASVCQVLESSVNEQNADVVYGRLTFAATRDYMTAFREGLSGQAEAVDGSVTGMSASVEDLTRQIVDTGARLEAQRTLRERLIALLEKDTDDIGDLLQVERELARVQAEIESTQSYLRTLESRVSMDRITVSYEPIRRPVTPSTAQPLREAFSAFFGVIATSLANVILFIGAALPWLLVVVPALFVLRWLIRRVRKAR